MASAAVRAVRSVGVFERILCRFPEQFSLAFAYGSGVFTQSGQSNVQENMIDFLFAVDDPFSWHKENIQRNSKHYSFLRYGGARLIEKIQENYGAKIYFNTLVPMEGKVIKYGVISTHRLIEDLLDWQTLYVSGRMHKPVRYLKKLQNEDVKLAITVNLQSALHASLLCLPETFSEEELFRCIAGLSYSGDFRMYIGEDKQKVKNLVKPQLEKFKTLYEVPLKLMPLHWNREQGLFEQDCSPSTLLHHLNLLPRAVQRNLLVSWSRDGRHSDIEEVLQALAYDSDCSTMVKNAVGNIVWWSSISQSCKGILTAEIKSQMKVDQVQKL